MPYSRATGAVFHSIRDAKPYVYRLEERSRFVLKKTPTTKLLRNEAAWIRVFRRQ